MQQLADSCDSDTRRQIPGERDTPHGRNDGSRAATLNESCVEDREQPSSVCMVDRWSEQRLQSAAEQRAARSHACLLMSPVVACCSHADLHSISRLRSLLFCTMSDQSQFDDAMVSAQQPNQQTSHLWRVWGPLHHLCCDRTTTSVPDRPSNAPMVASMARCELDAAVVDECCW